MRSTGVKERLPAQEALILPIRPQSCRSCYYRIYVTTDPTTHPEFGHSGNAR
jgi:hypothetical protein